MPRPLLPTISSGWFELLSEERSASKSNPMLTAEGEGLIPATRARQSGRRRSVAHSSRKARQWRAFASYRRVSGLPIPTCARPIRRKSLAGTANIPAFERLMLETGFDRHRMVRATVVVGPGRPYLCSRFRGNSGFSWPDPSGRYAGRTDGASQRWKGKAPAGASGRAGLG